MGYVERNLSPDESVLLKAKIHWFVFMPALAALVVSFVLISNGGDVDNPMPALLGGFLFLASIYLFTKAVLTKIGTELAVTTRRIVAKFGVIRRSTVELNHTKVESFNVDQGIFGRLFRFGTLTINGTGGVHTPIPSIADPLAFRRIATEQVENIQCKGV